MLYNNHVINSAHIFEPRTLLVLVVFHVVAFGYNHLAANRGFLTRTRARVLTTLSLSLAQKEVFTLSQRTIWLAEQNEPDTLHTEASALQPCVKSEAARRESSAAAKTAAKAAVRAG